MTNPNNAIGTNAAYSGRTSANAFNDVLAVLSRGIISGWACAPDSGMSVVLGGDGTTRDVAIAEDNIGNRTTINNISGSPVSVTIPTAPVNNSRIDLIVAYVDNPPEGSSIITDNYEACGLIVVQGIPASTPLVPDDGSIRTAITADGASGVTAYYVILAQITVSSGTTDIEAGMIAQGTHAGIANQNIQNGTIDFTKFAQWAVNNGIITQNDLSPAADTPADWWNLFDSLGAAYQGFYVTRYSTSGKFSNQPSQYANMITINNSADIIQIWCRYDTALLYRSGTANGWQNPTGGGWNTVFDSSNLNPCLYQIERTSTNLTTSYEAVAIPGSQITFGGLTPGAYYRVEVDFSCISPSVTTDELDMSILWVSGIEASYQTMDYGAFGNTAGSGRARRASGYFIAAGSSATISVGVSSSTVPNTIASYDGLIVVTRLK